MSRRPVLNPVRDFRCMWSAERADGPRTGCCAREQWQVCLDAKSRRDAQVYRVVTPFKVCQHHKGSVTLSVMLDNGAFARLRKVLREKGKKEPRRKFTELHFERIESLVIKKMVEARGPAEQVCRAS